MGIKTFNRANPKLKQIEVYNDFSGGLNTEQADNAIKDNQFRQIVNFDIDKAGSLTKRPGLYRIPHIEELMIQKANQVIKNQEILDNKKPVDISTLKIHDTIPFFDGKHWVLNYLTNWGVFTICLDKDMNVMTDLDVGETILDTYIQFYKDKDDLSEAVVYKNKISKYNDIFVLIKSFYSNAAVGSNPKKQVKLYTWNPIKKSIDNTKHIPGWIEASQETDETKLLNLTDYGGSQTIQIKSLDATSISNKVKSFFELVSIKKLNDELANIPTDAPFKIYLRETTLGTVLVKEYKQNTYELALTHYDKSPISANELGQIVFKNSNTLLVYLNTYIKGIDNNTSGVSKKGHGNYDKLIHFEVDVNSWTINWNKVKGPNSLSTIDYNGPSQYGYIRPCIYRYVAGAGYMGPLYFLDDDVDADYPYNSLYQSKPWRLDNLKLAQRNGKNRAQKIIVNEIGCPLLWDIHQAFGYWYKDIKFGVKFNYGFWTGKQRYQDPNKFQSTGLANTLYFAEKQTATEFQYKFIGFCSDKGGVYRLSLSGTGSPQDGYIFNEMCFPTIKTTTNLQEWLKKDINNQTIIDVNYRDYYSIGEEKTGVFYGTVLKLGNSKENTAYTHYYKDYSTLYQNEMLDESIFGFANSHWEVKYKTETNGPIKLAKPKSAYIENDIFYLENIVADNAKRLLLLNNINLNDIDWLNVEDVFGIGTKNQIEELKQNYINGKAVDISIRASFSLKGLSQIIELPLKQYEYFEFINAILEPNSIGVSINKVDNKLKEMFIYWRHNGEQRLLVELSSKTIEGLYGNESEVFNSMRFSISYEYLPNGFVGQVLNFKQQKYIKPNLNDLSYLWYNFINMSVYNQKTHPNIYDNKIHPNISSELVDYPTSSYDGSKSVEMFGIVPVNDVILQPGQQRFQVFFNMGTDGLKTKAEKLIAAITAMSVEDYTSMINSEDYSTTGFLSSSTSSDTKQETIGPNWKPFTEVFKFLDDDKNVSWDTNVKGKYACFDLTIPSTTSAYMVMVQIAQKDESEAKKPTPLLATVVETKIQVQPTGGSIKKENFQGLFDEFATTTNLGTYTSHLIAYGNSNKIFFSDTAVPSYFPYSRVVMLETPEAVQNCTIFQNKLIVSTNNSRYYIGGSSFDSQTDPFHLKVVSTDSGLLAPKSEVPMGNYLYFLDTSGIKILKNLFGTFDKEFAYETIDTPIKSIVPREYNACGVAYRDKYYLCFPNNRIILVYNSNYKCWVMYESQYFNFSNMFVNDDRLFGIDRTTFALFEFRDDVYVDNWNETIGYEKSNLNNADVLVQKGTPINCYLQTKDLNQAFEPHRKKYDYALISADIQGIETLDENNNLITQHATGYITPYIRVDDDLINYNFSISSDNANIYHYTPKEPEGLIILDDSVVGETTIVDTSTLGENTNSYYYVPITRSGNTISFGIQYNHPTGFSLNSISLKYSIRNPKYNRGTS